MTRITTMSRVDERLAVAAIVSSSSWTERSAGIYYWPRCRAALRARLFDGCRPQRRLADARLARVHQGGRGSSEPIQEPTPRPQARARARPPPAASSNCSRIALERVGDAHAAVLELVVLEQGDDGAADRDSGAVEGVDGPVAARLARSASDPPGLVVGAVRGRGQLAPGALRRDPGLAVVFLGGRAAEVAGGDVDDPVGDLQRLEDLLLAGEQQLVLLGGGLRQHERDHLDLVELGDPEDLLLVGRQEAGAEHRVAAHQHWRDHRHEAGAGQPVDGEADERELQHRARAGEVAEAGARDLGGAHHVDGAEQLAQLEMVARGEAELRDGTDAVQLDGVVLSPGRD